MTDTMMACFCAAVDTLNFTTAADIMHITQPAFSRNITQMEEELGFKLFLRSKKEGVRVTPAGAEFYNGLCGLQREYTALVERSKRINRGETGQLVIGIITGSCVDSKTMQSIKKFQEKYPNMKISLKCYSVAHVIDAVERGDCDICFMISSAVKDREDLLSETVFDIENYMFVPKTMMGDLQEKYSLADFSEQTFILSEDVPMINQLLVDHCQMAGFVPRTVTAPDYETKMLWCEIGMGIAVNSEDHYMKNSPNIQVVKVKEIEADSYSIIWHKNNFNPGIALYYSMFQECMSS